MRNVLNRGLLRVEAGLNCVHDQLFIRELTGLQLGIDQVAVQRYFETSASGRDQLKILNLLLVRG